MPKTKRRYTRRTLIELLEAKMKQLNRLEAATEKRTIKMGKLRNECQALQNRLSTPSAPVSPDVVGQ